MRELSVVAFPEKLGAAIGENAFLCRELLPIFKSSCRGAVFFLEHGDSLPGPDPSDADKQQAGLRDGYKHPYANETRAKYQ